MAQDHTHYPIHFKKMVNGEVATVYAHNKDQKSKFEADGYLDQDSQQWQRQNSARFPSLMYAKDGSTVRCENEADQELKVKQGFSVKPIIKKEPAAPLTAMGVPSGAEDRIEALESSVKSLSDGMARILEALGEAPHKGKKAS